MIRDVPLHKGSHVVVKLLEASERQGKYQAALEAVLEAQPAWTDQAQPSVELAFQAAEHTALNINQALVDAQKPEMEAPVQQDTADPTALKVSKTRPSSSTAAASRASAPISSPRWSPKKWRRCACDVGAHTMSTARKSFTLVWVGPVTTRSPSDSKKV